MKTARRDDNYQKWRWQPKDCDMPRFDAKLFIERLRNKRFMFVGDSLNRNQWESMVCLVQSAVSPDKKYVTWEDQRVVFHAWEFNATVEFYWSPFLVESNSDNPKIHSIPTRIIDAGAIAAHAENWRNADYLVFNTYIWWMNTLNMKLRLVDGWIGRRPGGQDWEDHDEVVRIEAYRKVLSTWAGWVNDNIDPARTSVFFMSMSPLHLRYRSNPTYSRSFLVFRSTVGRSVLFFLVVVSTRTCTVVPRKRQNLDISEGELRYDTLAATAKKTKPAARGAYRVSLPVQPETGARVGLRLGIADAHGLVV
uniref:Trichome birefringence-like C-terminal domain-containing protein n=1 Tax=Aegilops tauschii TaxID=37682 RepID=M8BI64_AEGTA